jgi:hypothetical protein
LRESGSIPGWRLAVIAATFERYRSRNTLGPGGLPPRYPASELRNQRRHPANDLPVDHVELVLGLPPRLTG